MLICKSTWSRWVLTHLNSVSGSRRPLLVVRIDAIWEQRLQESISTASNEIEQILDERILVLVGHASDVVHDISSVVADQELGTTSFEMGVCRET